MQAKLLKKNIGILTMHRVNNFGSVLQAFALQKVIENLDCNCVLIDYQYPNNIHSEDKENKSQFLKIIRFIMSLLHGRPDKKRKMGIDKFRTNYFKLSEYFCDYDSLHHNPPPFDTYVLGSDQTWNVRHIAHDDSFLLSFVKTGRKISYASSAARKSITRDYYDSFRYYLSQFDAISVRESNTQKLIECLIGIKPPILLDPTLLLDSMDWHQIAKTSKFQVKKTPYILVYILRYSFYPYPLATEVIRKLYKKYGCHLVIIRYSMRERLGIRDYENLYEGIAPEDFVALFENASFVITTSFHGTAFSINYNKPFYSIYNPESDDDRIISLLNQLGLQDRGLSIREKAPDLHDHIDYSIANNKLNKLRKESLDYLIHNL